MKTEGEARIEAAHRPRIDGEACIEGAKRPKIEGEARIEGKTRDKSGGRGLGGGPASPSPENLCKINSEMMQPGWILYIEIAWSCNSLTHIEPRGGGVNLPPGLLLLHNSWTIADF